MRFLKYGFILTLIPFMLTGCVTPQATNINAKKTEIKEYNELVHKTLVAYAETKIFAEQNKENMLNFLLKNTEWSLVKNLDIAPTQKEESKAFEISGIVYDKYFTALGADSLREVVIIKGTTKQMYVTIIWGKDKVHSINRVVKES